VSEPLLFPDANLQSPRTRRHKFPSTDAELKAAGYVFTGSAKCQGTFCQTWIYWYLTPNGKRLPMSKVVNCPGDILALTELSHALRALERAANDCRTAMTAIQKLGKEVKPIVVPNAESDQPVLGERTACAP